MTTDTHGLPPELLLRLRAVRLLCCDVDGVLTDGRIFVADDGRESKAFHVGDGIGIGMLQRAGIAVAWISGSSAPAIRHRAERLAVAHVLTGSDDKLPGWQRLLRQLDLGPQACAHIGDDLPDLPLLRACGVAFTVPHAPPRVHAASDYVTRAAGGRGAVREVCELILMARGELDAAIDHYDPSH
ncbi:MAG: HAD hydrolase family protein [Proteobacteria bacterium]|nr:HAD hydrolase family protein [Pseudomonadota bacterium]